jgi:hypothetical protein
MQKIDDILPEIEEMQRRGLIEIQNLNFKFRLTNYRPSGKARVISAPIFSETESRSTFTKAEVAPKIEQSVVAAKIQFTFRGFCVRNSKRLEKLRIILKVKFDADKIGYRFTNATQKQLIVENEDEHIKLDDQIMSLLLWIDAI